MTDKQQKTVERTPPASTPPASTADLTRLSYQDINKLRNPLVDEYNQLFDERKKEFEANGFSDKHSDLQAKMDKLEGRFTPLNNELSRRKQKELTEDFDRTYKDIESWPAEKVYAEFLRVNSLEEQKKAEASGSLSRELRQKALKILEKAREKVYKEEEKRNAAKISRRLSSKTPFETL